MTIEFSAMHLIVGDENPDLKDLKNIFSETEDIYEYNNTHYLIEKKIINKTSFWLYARYGKTSPYSPT